MVDEEIVNSVRNTVKMSLNENNDLCFSIEFRENISFYNLITVLRLPKKWHMSVSCLILKKKAK